MKCVCGYEYVDHCDEDESWPIIVDKGDERFYEIEGVFRKLDDDWDRTALPIKLHACPKCGTIRMEEV